MFSRVRHLISTQPLTAAGTLVRTPSLRMHGKSNVLTFQIGESGLNTDGSPKPIPFVVPKPPTFADPEEARRYTKTRLALAFRIFSKMGYEEGVAGHISVRDPIDPTSYWVNPFGKPFSKIKPSHLLWVSERGQKLGGGDGILGAGAFSLHASIHRARSNANAVCHSHSMWGRAFSALAETVKPITQDACAFYERQALFNEFDGIPADTVIGSRMASTLGPLNHALIMRNHGLLTVGETLDESVFWFPVEIGHVAAGSARDLVGNQTMGWWSAQPMFETAADENPDVFD
ncbi:hypothetical protein HDU98_006141 [Podochytrium sp. JEL0797]|nr:hypothetical protein HDU98_006141 [Podochytrium sp. JEL0797]